jgi:hypothetical protein
MTKLEKIRRALLKYPKLKAKDLAKKIEVSVQDVYSTRYLAKKQNKANGYAPLETEEKEVFALVCDSCESEEELVKTDMVNHPPHYTVGGVETIDFIEAKGLNYHLGQVIKYVSRAGKKGDALQDLQKARWYLNREIARVE